MEARVPPDKSRKRARRKQVAKPKLPPPPRRSAEPLDIHALFPPENRPKIEVMPNQAKFWKALDGFCAPESVIDAQGEAHGDIDLRLVQKLEACLVPMLGQWEGSDRWYHNLDVHGDGIRSLLFQQAIFDPRFIVVLRDLLAGEHADFCILCQIYDELESGDGKRLGSVAIRKDKIMVDRALVEEWATPV
jgi:hypothetical protein